MHFQRHIRGSRRQIIISAKHTSRRHTIHAHRYVFLFIQCLYDYHSSRVRNIRGRSQLAYTGQPRPCLKIVCPTWNLFEASILLAVSNHSISLLLNASKTGHGIDDKRHYQRPAICQYLSLSFSVAEYSLDDAGTNIYVTQPGTDNYRQAYYTN